MKVTGLKDGMKMTGLKGLMLPDNIDSMCVVRISSKIIQYPPTLSIWCDNFDITMTHLVKGGSKQL